MKKVSLVELSQMEVKPRKIIFKNEEFRFLLNDGYRSNFRFKLDDYILFEELNEPLIEIEEEPLLTDEEKEYLKMCIKFSRKKIKEIFLEDHDRYLVLNDGDDSEIDNTVYFKDKYFKKIKAGNTYTLKELGLEE